MDIDLIALQNSAAKIRNPFGFDFICHWNKKPIVLKGDGKWRDVIKPLRDHIANRLYDKIYNKYYDEQKALIVEKLGDRAGRKYTVPAEVSNLLWKMITGEDKPGMRKETQEDAADLTELSNELKKMASVASDEAMPLSISSVVEEAQRAALSGIDPAANDPVSARDGGTAQIHDEPTAPTDPLEATLGAAPEQNPPSIPTLGDIPVVSDPPAAAPQAPGSDPERPFGEVDGLK